MPKRDLPAAPKRYLPAVSSLDEFAALARLSRGMLYKEIKAGRLVARKIGDRTVVLAEDGDAWLCALPTLKTGDAA